MNETTRRLVYWAPRVICVALAAFFAIFALDVFSEPLDFWQKAVALVMHLIPTAMVLVALIVVWRREWIGAILFPLFAILHLWSKWGQLDWSAYAIIDGPLLLLGILFWVNWRNWAALLGPPIA